MPHGIPYSHELETALGPGTGTGGGRGLYYKDSLLAPGTGTGTSVTLPGGLFREGTGTLPPPLGTATLPGPRVGTRTGQGPGTRTGLGVTALGVPPTAPLETGPGTVPVPTSPVPVPTPPPPGPGIGRDDEDRAEQVFAMQQRFIEAQRDFLEQRNQQTASLLEILAENWGGDERVRAQAVSELERAIAGGDSPSTISSIQDVENIGSEIIRRNFSQGGETGTGALDLRKNVDITKAEIRDLARRNDINTAMGLYTGTSGVTGNIIDRVSGLNDKSLAGSQVLGQSISQLGKLGRFNAPQDDFYRNLGETAVTGLFSSGNAISNLASNIGGIGGFFSDIFTGQNPWGTGGTFYTPPPKP